MRTRAAVLSVVPAVVLGLVVAPQVGAAPRPTPPTPGARVTTHLVPQRPAIAAAATAGLRKSTEVRLLVRTTGATQARALRTPAARVGSVSSALARLGYLSVSVPVGQADQAKRDLAAMPGVRSVREAAVRTPDLVPTDPQYAATPSSQASMYNAVQAPTAWDTSTGNGALIAVLDAGFDATHEDLAGNVTDTWDVVNLESGVADAIDDPYSGHGTASASTAAAVTDNGLGIAGAAPAAGLLLVQVGDDTAGGGITEDASAAGIVWAADNGADVISMSYGSSTPSTVEADAVAYALGLGAVVVASAGNDGTTDAHYPAAVSGVVAVGATDHTGTAAADWSTRGSWVDLAAPGTAVRVAAPVGSFIDTLDGGASDGYAIVDGTSFSAPMVAGLAAVLRSAKPAATRTELTTALVTGTKPLASAVFGHGLVQVANALASFTDDTVLTSPTGGSAATGTVAVSATSSAPSVKFFVDGTTSSVTAPVVGGQADAVLPLYGISGTASVRAVGCYGTSCGTSTTSASITVTNNAPVLTSPVDGLLAELSFDAAATADGGSVRFLLDGATSLGLDAEAPYAITVDTATIADGTHTVTAVGCNADGSTCDTGNPSNASTIEVRRLRPTAKVSPSLFSPNGDGRKDTTTLTYTLDQQQTVVLRVYNAGNTLVRGPLSLGTNKATGTYTYVWNGKANSGAFVADGTYRMELSTTRQVGDATWTGLTNVSVRSDRTKPGLSSTSASPSSFYPYVDGYRDTTALGATTNEALSAITVTIYNSSGTKVRTLTGTTRPTGRAAVTWNGKSSSGKLLAAGTYKFTVMAQDVAGNRATTGKYSVTLSSKKLVKKTGTKVIAPYSYLYQYYVAECSKIFYNVRAGWPTTSLGYFSDYYEPGYTCYGDGNGDIALGWFRWTLPTAIKYGTVSVAAYGGSYPGYSDVAQLTYVQRDGSTAGYSRLLYGSDATYKGSSVSASTYLYNGKTLQWVVASAYGNWYETKNFTVTWTYYVLG